MTTKPAKALDLTAYCSIDDYKALEHKCEELVSKWEAYKKTGDDILLTKLNEAESRLGAAEKVVDALGECVEYIEKHRPCPKDAPFLNGARAILRAHHAVLADVCPECLGYTGPEKERIKSVFNCKSCHGFGRKGSK